MQRPGNHTQILSLSLSFLSSHPLFPSLSLYRPLTLSPSPQHPLKPPHAVVAGAVTPTGEAEIPMEEVVTDQAVTTAVPTGAPTADRRNTT